MCYYCFCLLTFHFTQILTDFLPATILATCLLHESEMQLRFESLVFKEKHNFSYLLPQSKIDVRYNTAHFSEFFHSIHIKMYVYIFVSDC